MCIIPWRVGKSGDTGPVTQEEGDEAGPLQRRQGEEGHAGDTVLHLLFVFGGMDMQGQIYRDCVVSLVE